jgi:Tfp pilus assembly PilM family ATPase
LSEEIKNILKFHYDHSEEKVAKIILSGGTAKMKNLPEYLQGELKDAQGVVIQVANPWANIPNLETPPLAAFDSLGLTAAIGLVMRTIDHL